MISLAIFLQIPSRNCTIHICIERTGKRTKYYFASPFSICALLPFPLVSQFLSASFVSQTVSLPLGCPAAFHIAASLCLILCSHIQSNSHPGHTHTRLPFLCPCKLLLVLNAGYCETNALRIKCVEITKWMGKEAQVLWHECVLWELI